MDTGKTEWYGGQFTNKRLHDIQDGITMCTVNNDINTWVKLLHRKNHELRGFQSPAEKTELENKITKLTEEINEHQTIARNAKSRNKPGIPIKIINSLHFIDYELDEIFNRSGLQTKVSEDAGDALN